MKIKKIAIKTPSGKVKTLPVGNHHADMHTTGKRGFVTSEGEFVGRGEAGKIAKKAGQVKKMPTPKLHSSNLKK
jgi:hypothetical protein